MSIENQKEILRNHRIKMGLKINEINPQYPKYESGMIQFGRSRCQTAYDIIKVLELSMDDLDLIIK